MVAHQHRSAFERPWLPSLDSGLLRPHPYCADCGAVKNVSSDKARGIGYYLNALAEMKRYLEKRGSRLSSAQVRLISMEMEGRGYADAYSTPGSSQRSAFVEIVRKYTSLSPSFIEGFL
jgi:hypothetical protein